MKKEMQHHSSEAHPQEELQYQESSIGTGKILTKTGNHDGEGISTNTN